MEQYIPKSALVAEIEKRIKEIDEIGTYLSPKGVLTNLLCHLDTLEAKEVYECDNVDLNSLFEEMDVEPDSRIASMFKNALYKVVDNYLDRKENKL